MTLHSFLYILSYYYNVKYFSTLFCFDFISQYSIFFFFSDSFSYCFINLISTMILINFSKYWNEMLKQIEAVENTLPPLRNAATLIKNSNRLVKIFFFFVACKYLSNLTSHLVETLYLL